MQLWKKEKGKAQPNRIIKKSNRVNLNQDSNRKSLREQLNDKFQAN